MPNNKMLIDASHPEETRVVVMKNGRVEEFDFESAARKLLKGSIFLAKVTRVEPSLQAAFVDYGGNRHGFLAFNEMHPDYYQIPHADRLALLEEEAAANRAANRDDDDEDDEATPDGERIAALDDEDGDDVGGVIEVADDDTSDDDASDDDDQDDVRASARPADDAISSSANADADADTDVGEHAAVSSADASADDVSGHEEDGGGDDTGSASITQEAVAPAGDDPADDARFAEIDAIAEETAIDVSGLLPDAAAADQDASGPADVVNDETMASEPTDEIGARVDTMELRVGSEPVVQSDLIENETPASGQGDDQPAIPGFEDQPIIEEIARAVEHRQYRAKDATTGERAHDDYADDAQSPAVDRDEQTDRPARPRRRLRSYKIQEVIKRRQIVLVQVVKEERGTKGAALTSYLSLAGRYTVLMPNTARGGGISRKITNAQDRKRLKAVAQELDVPEGMGLIIRTAGAARTKQEIKRDFEYLLRLWESVRDLTLNSTAPALVYEEGNLIKRAIRDLYTKDIDEIVVSGSEAHREAKDFMRMLMPSHAKNVVKYDAPESLFKNYGIEQQLNALFSPIVTLPSGGYLVINQTEALVAVDINSGRATREFSIEETAHKTNLEAAAEISRQLKLRDLAGLIVIDFIDMDEKRNNRSVERKIKDCLKDDRARIQVGRISHFGLLEMSRQRLRTGVLEGSTTQCEHCQGSGVIRSVESIALAVLRGIEDAAEPQGSNLVVSTAREVAFYLLNQKRAFISDLEARYGIAIEIVGSDNHQGVSFAIDAPQGQRLPAQRPNGRRQSRAAVSLDHGFKTNGKGNQDQPVENLADDDGDADDDGRNKSRRRRRRRGGRHDDGVETNGDVADIDAGDDDDRNALRASGDDEERTDRRPRRRGRRSGQRHRETNGDDGQAAAGSENVGDLIGADSQPYVTQSSTVAAAAAAARRRSRPQLERGGRRRRSEADVADADTANADATSTAADAEAVEAGSDTANTNEQSAQQPERKPRRTRGGRSRRGGSGRSSRVDETSVDADDSSANETSAKPVPAVSTTGTSSAATDADAPQAAEAAAPLEPAQSQALSPASGDDLRAADVQAPELMHETNVATSQKVNGREIDADPEVIDVPKPSDAQSAVAADTVGTDPAPDADASIAPREHWGEPSSSEPVIKRMKIGTDGADEPIETPQPAATQQPQKRGWWQRNFG